MVKPGGVCGQLVHQADILRTLADILGTKLPDNAGEDSFSLLPLLKGEDQPVRENAVSCAASSSHCCARARVHAARVQQALIGAVRFQTWSLSMFAHPRSMIA